MAKPAVVVSLVICGLAACVEPLDAQTPPATPSLPAIARVDCGTAVAGIAVAENLVEGQGGYDAALAALDLEGLPARLSLSALSPFLVSIVAYALDVRAELVDPVDRDTLLQTEMGRAVLAGFATDEVSADNAFDFTFFRRGFHRYYACSRGLPATRDDFLRSVGADDPVALQEIIDAAIVIDDTQPKAPLRRRLWSPPSAPEVFVAETLDDDGAVRETEIVWRGQRVDEQLEFLVFDPDGALSAGSHFATRGGGSVTSAAPYTCLFCHVGDDGRFDVVSPD